MIYNYRTYYKVNCQLSNKTDYELLQDFQVDKYRIMLYNSRCVFNIIEIVNHDIRIHVNNVITYICYNIILCLLIVGKQLVLSLLQVLLTIYFGIF